jgi:hypothetical protein
MGHFSATRRFAPFGFTLSPDRGRALRRQEGSGPSRPSRGRGTRCRGNRQLRFPGAEQHSEPRHGRLLDRGAAVVVSEDPVTPFPPREAVRAHWPVPTP